ncbi:MAG TPA: hypothetical protein PKY35_00805 [Candidatus Hydrogenedentes bacterium]|nr:hypothetical protein [Candidatus Hydrogenedentota bacterium]HOL75542.1 hypothetical protein [Candidatus Hydrogenedentota bacterium]HPO86016.1 hypothetical protein [Candidatus Hydrogenedentota bacterium]
MMPRKGFFLYYERALTWLNSSHVLPFHDAVLLIIMTCAGFASSGALVVFAYHFIVVSPKDVVFLTRLLAKVLVFGGISFTAGYVLKSTSARPRPLDVVEPRTMNGRRSLLVQFFVIVCLAAVFVLPNLDKYPFPEPDEMHHLIVSRNLCEYGEYASGHPETGFIRFDSYDSVGPTLLIPIAALFRVAGVHLKTARLVVGLFFISLCLVSGAFARRYWNTRYFVVPVICLIGAIHSVYLGRTVYGEVPALLFFLLSLHFWDKSQSNTAPSKVFAVLAGVFLGMTLLAKLFFLIIVWPLFGAMYYEYCKAKKISYSSSIIVMVTSLFIVFIWWLAQEILGDTQNSADMMGMYQTFLVFGFDSTKAALRWFFTRPLLTISWCITILLFIPLVMNQADGFPSRVMLLYVVFFLFWWIFFTPGHISRYLWYSSATLGLMGGQVVEQLAKRWLQENRRPLRRLGYIALTGLVCMPYGGQLLDQGRLVYVADETSDLRELTHFIEQLPENARVATTFWPLERSLNFLTGRAISRLKAGVDCTKSFDVVVSFSQNSPDFVSEAIPVAKFGKFCVWDTSK